MTRPWELLDAADRPEGRLELRRRGADAVIMVGGRVLMNGAAHRSEAALAELACRPIANRPQPRVFIGGLGMAFTLRAALDALPKRASIIVAEIDPLIVAWCRGPLADLTRNAVGDPRVRIVATDAARLIEEAAQAIPPSGKLAAPTLDAKFDAILLDLYEGPRTPTQGRDDPFYGREALLRTRQALREGGLFAVWSEDADAAFQARLTAAGFAWRIHRPGTGARHVVYLAEVTRPAAPRQTNRGGRSRSPARRPGRASP